MNASFVRFEVRLPLERSAVSHIQKIGDAGDARYAFPSGDAASPAGYAYLTSPSASPVSPIS